MLARVFSAVPVGVEALLVSVEVDLQKGLPAFATVGLPDEAVRESRDRVRAALINSGFAYPEGRLTINLAPASVRKAGSGFDLAIALGLLAASGLVRDEALERTLLLGELSLDGSLRPVSGVLPAAAAALRAGCGAMLLPGENAAEAALVSGLEVHAAPNLSTAAAFLNGEAALPPAHSPEPGVGDGSETEGADLAEVRGQEGAKRALEVCAAGGHNLLLVGPPGTGKTLLARCLPAILPPPSLDESLEATAIHSVAGLVRREAPLLRERPFRAPHHSVTRAGLAGGGAALRPGELSLAHRGVLFLDELPEFSRAALESLRQPLECGSITLTRAAGSLTYPARFILAAAMNPCPCGYLGHPAKECLCTPREVHRYRSRVSGPLLDRIDLHLELPGVRYEELQGERPEKPSGQVRERVVEARRRQSRRFGKEGRANAAMTPRELRRHCRLDREGSDLLREVHRRHHLSGRGLHRILKVARTAADLAGAERIELAHLAEAVQYRTLDLLPR